MNRIPILAGPTAVGKTSVALRLAKELGAEIISSDSRQIYRNLNIGTAKPPEQILLRVRHHLINELDLSEPYSAGIFARMAEERIEEIISRGNVPIITGGSTLYLQALMSGLADIPEIASGVRQTLNARLQAEGPEILYRDLLEVDPAFASTLDATKSQRIVRGLEVFMSTGRTLTSFFSSQSSPRFKYELFILTRNRAYLYERIDQRVDKMIDDGLLDEVRGLVDNGVSKTVGALKTIGYKEVFRFLDGQLGRDEMVDLIKKNTRRYAKRQLTWFRKYEQATWIDLDRGEESKIIEILLNSC